MEHIIAAILAAASCTGATDQACAAAAQIAATRCEFEDGDNCYWHGGIFGNGSGRSFVSIDGKAVTIPRKTADLLLRADLAGANAFDLAAADAAAEQGD